MTDFEIGDRAIHRLDPLNRIGIVRGIFNWLGQRKLVVVDAVYGKERMWKDFEYEFVRPGEPNDR